MSYRLYSPEECGRDGYPPVWHERLKCEVREQAGNRCIRCGHPYQRGQHGRGEWTPCDERCTHVGPFRHQLTDGTWVEHPQPAIGGREQVEVSPYLFIHNGAPVEARWRILTVHHLDGNKANCRWWNLVALCQRCHLTIQGKVRMERVWPWEHSEWFRPYVAGYYAWAYLGEDLTREEATARMDDLLALERAA